MKKIMMLFMVFFVSVSFARADDDGGQWILLGADAAVAGLTVFALAEQINAAEEYIKADAAFRIAIDCNPKNPVLWNSFGEANYKAGRIHSADAGFAKVLELDP
ncbi:MAG: hypothetical protein ACLFP1_03855 [Candidatus Goldiibacteriota bacterium]